MFRKLFILMLWPLGAMSLFAQSNVTFSVDISNAPYSGQVYVSGGTIDGWCGTCTPMSDADGDGIYETTLSLPSGPHEFKYLIGDWGGAELFDASAPCTLTTGDFTNRYIVVDTGYTALPTVCFNQCVSCDFTQPVTFEVDMRQVVTGDQGVFIAGDFNGWDGFATPMSDPDGDDIWQTTLNLPLGFHNFRFVNNGGWFEFPPAECVEPDYNNRYIEVVNNGGEPMHFSACFDSCAAVCDPLPTADITLQVDMASQIISEEGVFVMSTINDNWYLNEYIVEMSDPDGDQIYSVTLPVADLSYFHYVFMNGNPYDGSPTPIEFNEEVPGECTGGWTRVHHRTGETTEVLPVVCFGQCDADCSPVAGCMDPTACNFNPAANVDAECTYPTPGLDCLGRCTDAGFANQPHISRYTEDFSGFAPGDLIAETDPGRWIRWYADAGPEIDATITEADGNQAVRIVVDSGVGQQSDVVLLLNQSEGVVDLSFDVKIAAGHGAYFNFQGTATPGDSFGPQMYIYPDGHWELDGPNLFSLSGSGFPVDSYTYANIHFIADLDADIIWLLIDGELMGQETFPVNLGGVDFYALDAGDWSSDYEVDNIRLTLPALDGGVSLACQTPGCTYPDADNYASQATTDDGTCTFTTGGSCLGDLDADENITVSDMLILLGAFGSACE